MKTKRRGETISLDRVRIRLSRLWFIGSGLICILLVIQTVVGQKYTVEEMPKVWSWFVPTTFPTLSLMVGVMGAGATRTRERQAVKRGFSSITMWLSFTYLTVLALTIFLEPLSQLNSLKLFEISNYYLTPIQGLVVTAIGFIFTSKQDQKEKAPDKAGHEPSAEGVQLRQTQAAK